MAAYGTRHVLELKVLDIADAAVDPKPDSLLYMHRWVLVIFFLVYSSQGNDGCITISYVYSIYLLKTRTYIVSLTRLWSN